MIILLLLRREATLLSKGSSPPARQRLSAPFPLADCVTQVQSIVSSMKSRHLRRLITGRGVAVLKAAKDSGVPDIIFDQGDRGDIFDCFLVLGPRGSMCTETHLGTNIRANAQFC